MVLENIVTHLLHLETTTKKYLPHDLTLLHSMSMGVANTMPRYEKLVHITKITLMSVYFKLSLSMSFPLILIAFVNAIAIIAVFVLKNESNMSSRCTALVFTLSL